MFTLYCVNVISIRPYIIFFLILFFGEKSTQNIILTFAKILNNTNDDNYNRVSLKINGHKTRTKTTFSTEKR